VSSADRAAPDALGLAAQPVHPSDLATAVLARLPGALLAFDVDGVLAPLVEHVDQSALTPGVDAALAVLARHTQVTLLSGRSLESLARLLDFPPGLIVIGSHGLEVHGGAGLDLTGDEQDLYELLTSLGRRCVDECGPGAWLEYKPASVAVHTRQADRERARDAVAALVGAAMRLDEATVKAGHQVVELFVRDTDKGTALLDLAARVDATSIVFLGDDRTDEEAFARMGPDDLSVRVGPGDTVARLRLAGHAEAAEFVKRLADSV
jgi:trehalose 6-phosphate phosphatase